MHPISCWVSLLKPHKASLLILAWSNEAISLITLRVIRGHGQVVLRALLVVRPCVNRYINGGGPVDGLVAGWTLWSMLDVDLETNVGGSYAEDEVEDATRG